MKIINTIAFTIVTMTAFLTYAVETKKLSMICYDQYWVQPPTETGKAGSWMTGIGFKKIVTLEKDPNYPNANEPRTFWLGEHSEVINEAKVLVHIQAIELDGKSNGYLNKISISRNGIVAESDGGSYLRSAFRTDQFGVGAICNQFTFL